jgi:hypothetical protein
MAQVGELLSSKHKALSFIPSATPRKITTNTGTTVRLVQSIISSAPKN